MASLSNSESRRLYSWWWDSHNSPKNSKWLQDNLKDMDSKVKAMIKLIEEDADSFARRAEMYYKKRPELMKLVEEFYRAYRALAERYNHATVELRHAHRTMEAAFPNQVPFMLGEDSPSESSANSPKGDVSDLSLFDLRALKRSGPCSEASDSGFGKKGLILNEMFGEEEEVPRKSKLDEESTSTEMSQLSNENQNLKNKVLQESERAGKAETEIQNLKQALSDTLAEKEAFLLQYQKNLEKISHLEEELNSAQEESREIDEQANKAKTEVQSLKEELVKLEIERDAGCLQQKEYLDRISCLESMIVDAQNDVKELNMRAVKGETEAEYLKKELARLETEKEAVLLEYNQCLTKLSLAESEAKLLTERAEKAETQVGKLESALAELNEQKEAMDLQYKRCLEKISKLESAISCAQEEVKRLNNELLMGAAKLKNAEVKHVLLETSNQSLRLEADKLAKKIAMKDQELVKKHEELETLQICLQNEQHHFLQIESTLHALQDVHSKSQEEQRALTVELKNGIQLLQDLVVCKQGLEEEIKRVKDENQSLNEVNSSSTFSMNNLQNEILSLRAMKERLEEEVASQMGRSNNLEQELHHLKEEIKTLNIAYQALMEQVESAGLNPESIQSSVKILQDENSRLAMICKRDIDEKEALLKKLASTEKLLDTNAALESSLSDVNGELGLLREKVETLTASSELLQEEKYSLVAEKASLLSQLQSITENMMKLMEKNTVLENSLSGENVKLESLREKSKNLEDICQSLSNEKSSLLTEKGTLVIQLEDVERRLENLEKRYTELDVKYADLSKDKEATQSEVEKLRFSLSVEKQERGGFTVSSNGRLATLENHVHFLQEENRWRKKESEEELEKVMNAQFEIFILKKFVQDMEEKNYYLLIECQKQIEESRMTEKLISELERENLEQQVEAEILFDEIEKLRVGISQVFKALEIGPVSWCKEKIETEKIFKHLLGKIKEMKGFLSNYRDDKQRLWFENSVLLILLEQLRQDVSEIESEKILLDQKLGIKEEELLVVQSEKHDILEMNRLLTVEMIKSGQRINVLEAEQGSLYLKQKESQRAYLDLQEEFSKVVAEKRSLLKKFSDLNEEKSMVDEENKAILLETLSLSNLSVIFKSSGNEKAAELKALEEDLVNFQVVCSDLKDEVRILKGKLVVKETDNLLLKNSIGKLDKELSEIRDINDQLMEEVSSGKDFLMQKETDLSEAERKLKSMEILNSELCLAIAELKKETEDSKLVNDNLEKQIKELTENNTNRDEEIANLEVINMKLASELDMLHKDLEEHQIQEENLTFELQQRNMDVELWEAEASTFYFDLQISSIREILYEDKVNELNGVCERLVDESASKTTEIENMNKRVYFMKSEIGELKCQLFACTPQIDSLRQNIASLEKNTLWTSHNAADGREEKVAKFTVHPQGNNCQETVEDGNASAPNGIPDYEKLQARVKAVEKVVVEEMDRLRQQESFKKTNIKLEAAAAKEIQVLKPKGRLGQQIESEFSKEHGDGNFNLQRKKPETSLMKDIPLDQVSEGILHGMSRRRNGRRDDQMLQLVSSPNQTFDDEMQKHPFEPAEGEIVVYKQRFKDVNQKSSDSSELQLEDELGIYKAEESKQTQSGNKRKILERLASDAQKLTSVSTIVQELRRKLDANKKNKKAKGIDFETVKEQLEEFEESVTYLVDMNGKLTKNVKESLWCSDEKGSLDLDAGGLRRKRITEQARKVSEKLGRLQLEVQKVQYVLLKVDDEKKGKTRERFFRTRTSIILRDFIGSGKRSSERQKKARMCACLRPAPSGGVSPLPAP